MFQLNPVGRRDLGIADAIGSISSLAWPERRAERVACRTTRFILAVRSPRG